MADQTANVVLTADVSNYTDQLQQAEQQTTSLTGAVDSLSDKLGNLSKATGRGLVLFGSGTLAGLSAMTASAAIFEKQMSTLRATAAATGKDISGTEQSITKLSIAFPIARGEAVALYTQLNNLGIKGTKNMESLATTMVRLGGATGESIGGLTQGFVELSRSMGTLSGGQTSRYANSLYTVSRNAGVAASSVLAFSNAIAPMARVTGIGMQEVLGISTAFTKAGADGYYAANTFSSMLADISRQVQYGSPNIRKYSDLIGVTADQFAKMDRTEAITRIFETIGKSGPEAVKILDRMGYDGIRAARSITAVATSAGGIRKAVADSTGSFYGNDLQKGSDAAYKSLSTELEQTKDTINSIGSTIGSSMLAPLRQMVSIFNSLLSGANAFVNALKPLTNILAPVVTALGAIAPILGGMALASFAKIKGAAAVEYARNSATAASFAGGMAAGRGTDPSSMSERQRMANTQYANTQRAMSLRALYPSPILTDPNPGEASKLNNRMLPMTAVQRGIFTFGQGVGKVLGDSTIPVWQRPLTLAARGATAIVNWNRDFYREATLANPYDRTRFTPSGFMSGYRAGANPEAGMTGAVGGMLGSLRLLGAGLTSSASAFGTWASRSMTLSTALGGLTRSVVEMTWAATRAAGELAAKTLTRVAGGANSVLGALGITPGILGAGLAAYGVSTWFKARRENEAAADPNNFRAEMGLQRVNEKLGIGSTDGTNRSSYSLRDKEAALFKPTTKEQALSLSPAQRAIAESPGRKYTNELMKYARSPEEAIAITRAGGYLTPQQLQEYGFDVMKRFTQADERKYSSGMLSSPDVYSGNNPDPSGVVGMLKMADRLEKTYSGVGDKAMMWSGRVLQDLSGPAGIFAPLTKIFGNSLVSRSNNRMTKQAEGAITEGITGIQRTMDGATKAGYSDKVGRQLGVNELTRTLNVLADPSTSEGVRTKAIAGLSDIFGETSLKKNQLSGDQLTALRKAKPADRAQMLLDFMYDPNTSQGQAFYEANGQYFGGDKTEREKIRSRGGSVYSLTGAGSGQSVKIGTPEEQKEKLLDALKNDTSSPLVRDLKNMGPLGQLVLDANANIQAGGEGNTKVANEEMEKLALGARNTGKSFGEISVKMQEAATRLGETNEATRQAAKAAMEFADKLHKLDQLSMSRDARRTQNYQDAFTQMRSTDPEARAAGREKLFDYMNNDFDFVRNVYMTARNYQVGRKRTTADYERNVKISNRDFNTQMAYGAEDYARSRKIAEEDLAIQKAYAKEDFELQKKYSKVDFLKSRDRAREDFARQEARSIADFEKQKDRSTADYEKSRARASDDFKRSAARADDDFLKAQARGLDDFNRARLRSQDDFDRSMVRRAQAAARAIYAPFQRITTMQTMDAANLVMNLNKQNKMIQDQVNNLLSLKKSGLSQDVIDTLGLAESANAQQVARLLSDSKTSPAVIKELNAAIAKRGTATATLTNSDLSVDYRQGVEDFALSMTRNKEDFTLSTTRATTDFNLAQTRASDDFALGLERMATDFTTQMTRASDDFMLQLTRSRSDFKLMEERNLNDFEENTRRYVESFDKSMTRMEEGFQRSATLAEQAYNISRERANKAHALMLSDMENSYNITLEYMKQDLLMALEDVSGSINDFGIKAGDILKAEVGSRANAMIGEISRVTDAWYTAMNYLNSTGYGATKGVNGDQGGVVNPATQTFKPATPPPTFTNTATPTKPRGPQLALGGIITTTTHATIGEAGYPEAVIPLNTQGAQFMAGTIKEALAGLYASPTKYQGASSVTNIDKSTQFTGAITVVSNDPNEMARRLEDQSRLRRLVRSV